MLLDRSLIDLIDNGGPSDLNENDVDNIMNVDDLNHSNDNGRESTSDSQRDDHDDDLDSDHHHNNNNVLSSNDNIQLQIEENTTNNNGKKVNKKTRFQPTPLSSIF